MVNNRKPHDLLQLEDMHTTGLGEVSVGDAAIQGDMSRNPKPRYGLQTGSIPLGGGR